MTGPTAARCACYRAHIYSIARKGQDVDEVVIFLILAACGTAYAIFLSYTDVGESLNTTPEFQPFLTAAGLVPVLVAMSHLYGGTVATLLFVFLVAVGGPFVVRASWRITWHYLRTSRTQRRTNQYSAIYQSDEQND